MTPGDGDPLAVAAVVARALDTLGVRYSIGGSIASSMGGEPRSTLDVDVVAELTAELVPQSSATVSTCRSTRCELPCARRPAPTS